MATRNKKTDKGITPKAEAPKRPSRAKIQSAPFGSMSEEEILAMAEAINRKNKLPLEKMPTNSPEQARAFLEACGYTNLPPVKPNF